MKYQIELDKWELTLLKAAVKDYINKQKDRVKISLLNNDFDGADLAKDLEYKLIILGGKLNNIIPVANKITEEN